MQMFWGSVKNSKASNPPSRPKPEAFTPPNGVRRSRNNHVLTQTMPDSMPAATRWARFKSVVHSVAARP